MFWLDWGGDFIVAPNGGLLQANGWDVVRQSIARAVLTNPLTTLPSGTAIPPEYVYEPSFGAGMGLYVGQDMNISQRTSLAASIKNQVLQAPGVNTVVPPSISFTPMAGNGVLVQVQVTLNSGKIGTVTLQVY